MTRPKHPTRTGVLSLIGILAICLSYPILATIAEAIR
jgi:hypothetical protein